MTTTDDTTEGCLPKEVGVWTIGDISLIILVKGEHFAGTTQPWVLVTVYSNQSTNRCKCEIFTTRDTAKVDHTTQVTTIKEANEVETRSGERQTHQ